MPKEANCQDDSHHRDPDTGIERTIDFPGNHIPTAQPACEDTNQNEPKTTKLEEDIRSGERWLIWIGVTSILINSLIAWIYWGQFKQMKTATQAATTSADAAKQATDIAYNVSVLQNRPWVKMTPKTKSPLMFDVNAESHQQPVAAITIYNTLENIGNGVALHVFEWEDLVPVSLDAFERNNAADIRQSQWCDANRDPNLQTGSGHILFPRDSVPEEATVGPKMSDVRNKIIRFPGNELDGKVGFILVGCVAYKFSFEPKSAQTHQTRFKYYVGTDTQKDGLLRLYMRPQGSMSIHLKAFVDGFSAD